MACISCKGHAALAGVRITHAETEYPGPTRARIAEFLSDNAGGCCVCADCRLVGAGMPSEGCTWDGPGFSHSRTVASQQRSIRIMASLLLPSCSLGISSASPRNALPDMACGKRSCSLMRKDDNDDAIIAHCATSSQKEGSSGGQGRKSSRHVT